MHSDVETSSTEVPTSNEAAEPAADSSREIHEPHKKKRKKDDSAGTKRGIETMFRTAYRTHLDLSGLADTKANIMISINGIIISIIAATTAASIDGNPWLLLPAAVFLVSCVTALVFSVLAAMPRLGGKVIDPEKLRSKKKNFLFFGTFVHMSEEDFVDGIKDLMRQRGDLYGAMAQDLYSLGGVLARKYRLIRTAYTVFMCGLVAGVVLLVVVLGLQATAAPPAFIP